MKKQITELQLSSHQTRILQKARDVFKSTQKKTSKEYGCLTNICVGTGAVDVIFLTETEFKRIRAFVNKQGWRFSDYPTYKAKMQSASGMVGSEFYDD